MELNSWEAASRSSTSEFPDSVWNPKVYDRVEKNSPLVSFLNQIDPVLTTPFYFSKISFNIIFPPTRGTR
jgi:hypothetical protein